MKISNHIHKLNIPFKISLSADIQVSRSVNVFLVEGEQLCLIDCGVAGSETQIFNYIQSIGRKVSELKYVLLTHAHPDHIGALKKIKEGTGCKVFVHEAEKAWVEDTELQFSERPVPGFQNLVLGSCKIDAVISDEQVLDLASDISFKVIHCPGHSAGSVAYLHRQDNALMCGDIIPVKGDIPIYDNYIQSVKSLEKLENYPYPEFLFSAWDDPKIGEDVDEAISNGFEVLYSIHAAAMEAKSDFKQDNELEYARFVLEKANLPSRIVNPLFVRGLLSHL